LAAIVQKRKVRNQYPVLEARSGKIDRELKRKTAILHFFLNQNTRVTGTVG